MSSKKNSQTLPPNEIVFYETEDGKVSIAVRFENENIWLTQKHMAELFDCSTDNISVHLKNIHTTGELSQNSTTEKFSVVQQEGNRSITRSVSFYNLEAVIAVGYRVNSERGIAFRAWATDKLKNYIFKGFAIDSERFKKGSKILSGLGKVSHEVAVALAEKEHDVFRKKQDQLYKSDFDKLFEARKLVKPDPEEHE